MPVPYEQLFSSKSSVPRSPYMRLPSYQSLRRRRYHPYSVSRAQSSFGSESITEPAEEADFEADISLACVNSIPVSFSLPAILEDDCMAGLRTVVSQMTGRDSAEIRIGSVPLVIDFALILRRRNHLCNEAATRLPPTSTIGLPT